MISRLLAGTAIATVVTLFGSAAALAAPDDPFELGSARPVRGFVARWGAGKRRPEEVRIAADELPAEVEIPAQRGNRRDGVELGGVDGGDCFGPGGFDQRGDQRVPRGEVRVDGLTGDAGRLGELLHAGVGPFAELRAGRGEDGVDAAPGVGAAATGRGDGLGRIGHHLAW